MNFNRAEIKRQARDAIRMARPSPALVTFVYLLLASLPATLVSLPVTLAQMQAMLWQSGGFPSTLPGSLPGAYALESVGFLPLFLSILVFLYVTVMGVGYARYAMRVKRGEPAGYGDLFSAFSMVGRILAVNLLVALFTFLWSLLGIVGVVILVMVAALFTMGTGSIALYIFFIIAIYVAFLAFLYNRAARFTLVNYILLDRPELGALECLQASKTFMRGNIWRYFVFILSFIGWTLLVSLAYLIVFSLGLWLLMLTNVPSTGGLVVLVLLSTLAGFAVSMWVSAYISVASVGFYDTVTSLDQPLRQAPAFQSPPYQPPTYVPPVTESPVPPTERPPQPEPPAPPQAPPAAPTPPPDEHPEEEPEL